jgi:hypothetical protein
MVEHPARPNNSVLFDIPDGSSSTGPLNLRSSNEMFDGWGYAQLYESSDAARPSSSSRASRLSASVTYAALASHTPP